MMSHQKGGDLWLSLNWQGFPSFWGARDTRDRRKGDTGWM